MSRCGLTVCGPVTDQGMPKRKRTEQRVRVYTQEELLKEAEQTEIMNRESLAELLKIEEESRVVSLFEVAKRVCCVCVAFACWYRLVHKPTACPLARSRSRTGCKDQASLSIRPPKWFVLGSCLQPCWMTSSKRRHRCPRIPVRAVRGH